MKRVLALIAVSTVSFVSAVLVVACAGDEPGALPPRPEKDASEPDTNTLPDAGPAVPQTVGGLILWLDGADSNSVQRKLPGSDESVVKWLDKSGNKRDYAPPAPANAPKFAPGTMNGHTMSSVLFGQVYSQHLVGPSLSLSEAEAFVVVQTVRVTYRITGDASPPPYGLWHFGTTASLHPGDDGRLRDSFGSKSNGAFTSADLGANAIYAPHIFDVAAGPQAWNAYSNGVALNVERPSPYSFGFNTTGSLIGASNDVEATSSPKFFFNGYIAEVLVYNRSLASADHDAIQSYLAAKWGITLKPDGGT